MQYILAIDQGSHSSRAILYDETNQIVAHQSMPVTLLRKNKHVIEHDPLEVLDSINTVLEKLFASLEKKVYQNIVACGIACQRSTVLACDHQGQPLSAAISWQDVRGAAYLNSLPLSAQQIRRISGLPVSAHYAASKCRWLLEHDATVKAASRENLYLAPLSSFLLRNLVNHSTIVVDHTQAQRMQLLDIDTLDWSETLCSAFKITKGLLPACKPVCDHYGVLKDTHIPVTAVCGDQNAALFGCGDMNQKAALINLGSGAFILRLLPRLKHSDQLLSGIACSAQQQALYMREGTVNGAGNAVEWFLKRYPVNDWQRQIPIWLNQVSQAPLFINTVGGVGSPWWLHDIEPRFVNLNGDPDKTSSLASKAVAVIESIVFLLQDNLAVIQKEQETRPDQALISSLIVSGGLSQLDGLCQKLADLSQLPVRRLHDKETTAAGAANLARQGIMCLDNQAIRIEDSFQPDTENREYSGLFDRYQLFRRYLTKAHVF